MVSGSGEWGCSGGFRGGVGDQASLGELQILYTAAAVLGYCAATHCFPDPASPPSGPESLDGLPSSNSAIEFSDAPGSVMAESPGFGNNSSG